MNAPVDCRKRGVARLIALSAGVVALSSWPATTHAQDAAALYRRCKASIVTVSTDEATGTGFVVEDGSVVFTCYHVVSDGSPIHVKGVESANAVLKYYDKNRDVAILRLSKRFRSALTLRKSTPEPGTRVYVIGSALGVYERTITEGLVSGIRHEGDRSLLQISASITHGNSGSPVLDVSGDVVGMAQSFIPGTSINLAVTSYDLRLTVDADGLANQDEFSPDLITGKRGRNHKKSTGPNEQVTLGRLGEAAVPTEIRDKPNMSAQVLMSVSPSQRLVYRHIGKGNWLLVPLKNGKVGFIPKDDVYDLPYTVYLKPKPSEPIKAHPVVAELAISFIGLPYVKGRGDTGGMGTSELMQLIYRDQGIELPHDLDAQRKVGKEIKRLKDLLPGDRLYFKSREVAYIELAGIYIGDWKFVTSDPSEGNVCSHSLRDPKWRDRLVGARR